MTLDGSNLAIFLYVLFMIISLAVSYLYGWKVIEMTGLFVSQTFIASVINLFMGVCAIFGWFLYSWGVNEALFFGGLVLGLILLAVSEIALIVTLYLQREKLTGKFHEQMEQSN
ncbi:hypothetical protein [Virgibacillus doumboii]|uniref:hypothetical protein n=1 Tax=Virgibacillus doumboii TaxID=2697503 RepID=UPI001FE4B4B2|nr:hypothetical protein [Virgibacillus doumboii]